MQIMLLWGNFLKTQNFFVNINLLIYYNIGEEKMDPIEEKQIIEEILKARRLPYSIELLDVQGDKYTVRNNFGSTMVYIKKEDHYFLEEELE